VARVKQAATAVVRWFGQSPARVWFVIFGLYLCGRVGLIAGGQVFLSYDAFTYAPRPGQPDDGLLSFTGHAPRPWGLPLFYAPLPNDTARTVAQWAVGTVAWAYLAWEVGRHLTTRTARYLTVSALLLLALLHAVASWDLAILTESLSLSFGALVIGLLLHWLRTGRLAALVAMTAVAIWWSFLRPDIRVFTAIVIGVLVLVAVRAGWGFWRRRAVTRTAVAALASATVLGLGIVWYAAITPALEDAGTRYDADAIEPPMKQDEHRLVYRLRVEVSTNPELWAAFKNELGMPTCPELEAFTADRVNWRGREWAYAYKRCPPLVEWVNERKNNYFWSELARANPGLFARTFLQELSYMLGGEIYAHVPHVVPAAVEKIVFPSRRYGLQVALAGMALTLGLAWWSGAARPRPGAHAVKRRHAGAAVTTREHRRLVWLAIVLFGTALLSAVSTIMLVTGELQRFGVQEATAVRVGMIALLGASLDVWLRRRGGGVSSPEAATPGQAPAAA